MAKSPENSTLEEILGQYQRSLRERANRSIHQLKCALKEGDTTLGEDGLDPSFNTSVGNEDARAAWHELQHSHAGEYEVNQLKALLHQQATREGEVSPRRRKMSPSQSSEYEDTSLPTVHNLVPIINDQSQYIHHLEAEVKFCKDMEKMYLFSFLKEKLKLIYEEKNEILESQLKFLRKDLAESQKNCEDLKERLKHKESLLAANIPNRVGGLCLKCAQHEAVLSQTHNNVHMHTIERLTKPHYVMKKALIQCEQLKNELERQTERLEKELASQQEKRAFEKEMMKKEITKEKEDRASEMWMEKLLQCNVDFQMVGMGKKKMLTMSQNVAQLEAQVEKLTREKISAVNQLEEIKNQLASQEMGVTKVCEEMRYQLNKTKMEKDEAEKEQREYRTKTIRDLEIKDQEIEKLRLELSESKQHWEQEQQKAARAREECLQLTALLGESEHQLHLTRLEKDSIQQSFSNDAKAQALQAQQREQELTQKIQQMEAQHDKTVFGQKKRKFTRLGGGFPTKYRKRKLKDEL
ncbi:centrosomal colon cancer autoantigen-like protein [Camelus ferus]|nr:centrosomal colon cancer autoantigen-like protein [Camelus ferus]